MSLGFSSPNSPLGGAFDQEIEANLRLLRVFRERNWPVFFSSVVYKDDTQAHVFRQRLPDLNILHMGSHWVDIDERLQKRDNEVIIEKCWPSAFFKTDLDQQLAALGVDTLVVTGLTTSGCVRATALDGLQNDLLVFVPHEACGDRNHSAHLATLHDIHAKYGVVLDTSQLIKQLENINA